MKQENKRNCSLFHAKFSIKFQGVCHEISKTRKWGWLVLITKLRLCNAVPEAPASHTNIASLHESLTCNILEEIGDCFLVGQRYDFFLYALLRHLLTFFFLRPMEYTFCKRS
jgi:hypothetical protein